jgi:hypothetical protein
MGPKNRRTFVFIVDSIIRMPNFENSSHVPLLILLIWVESWKDLLPLIGGGHSVLA